MKKGWTYRKLGEVGTIVTGSTPSTKDEANYSSPDYCFIKPSDLPSNGIAVIDESEFHISAKAFSTARQLPKGSVVVSCIGIIGKVGILNIDACTNQQINAIIPNETIIPKCLAYIICNRKRELVHIANAPVVPIINKNEFSKFSIPVPPLSEQQSIVAELDKINMLISLKKAQLNDLDNLAQSIFYEMFGDPVENEKGWEVKKLGEIAADKLSYGSGASAIYYNGETRYVRITDITDNGELDNNMVSPSTIDEKYLLNDGDILFARSGATVGKTFLYTSKYGRCIYAGYLIRYIPDKDKVIPNYVFGLTKTQYYKSFIANNQKAVAQPNINAKQYGDLKIPLPPLPLQQTFAKRIEMIERQKGAITSAIKDLETLLASRMQYWFD